MNKEFVWTPEAVWMFCDREKVLALSRIEPLLLPFHSTYPHQYNNRKITYQNLSHPLFIYGVG